MATNDDEEKLSHRELAQRDLARQAQIEQAAAARRLQWERDNPKAHKREQAALAAQRAEQEAQFEASRPKKPEAAPGRMDEILERPEVKAAVDAARARGGVVAAIKKPTR